ADVTGGEKKMDDRQRRARVLTAHDRRRRLVDLPIETALGVRHELQRGDELLHQNSFRNTTSATKPFCRFRPIVLPRSRRSSVPHGPTVCPAMPRPWNGSRL